MQYFAAALALAPSFVTGTADVRTRMRGTSRLQKPLRELVAPLSASTDWFTTPGEASMFTAVAPVFEMPKLLPVTSTLTKGTMVSVRKGTEGVLNGTKAHICDDVVDGVEYLGLTADGQAMTTKGGHEFVCSLDRLVDCTCPKCEGKGKGDFNENVQSPVKCYRCRGKGWMDATDRKHAIAKNYESPRV